MPGTNPTLDLLFLGSGNAFGAEGRAFSSFLLNDRYLFDCGPTLLQQLQKANVPANQIDVVFISHFHADHFFGLPFLFLHGRYGGRTTDITIVGPPGIQRWTEGLIAHGYPNLLKEAPFGLRYVEVGDGFSGQVCGLSYSAAEVQHVEQLQCFAYRAEIDGRSVVYSGDTTLCEGLIRIVEGADVVVLECSTKEVPVHLSLAGVREVAGHAPGARMIVTHLDGPIEQGSEGGLIVAEDLGRYVFRRYV